MVSDGRTFRTGKWGKMVAGTDEKDYTVSCLYSQFSRSATTSVNHFDQTGQYAKERGDRYVYRNTSAQLNLLQSAWMIGAGRTFRTGKWGKMVGRRRGETTVSCLYSQFSKRATTSVNHFDQTGQYARERGERHVYIKVCVFQQYYYIYTGA